MPGDSAQYLQAEPPIKTKNDTDFPRTLKAPLIPEHTRVDTERTMSTLRTSLFASRLLLLALILLFPILWLFFTDHGSAQIAPIKSSISEWTASTGFLSSSGGDRYSDGRASGGVYREVGGETKFVKGVAGASELSSSGFAFSDIPFGTGDASLAERLMVMLHRWG